MTGVHEVGYETLAASTAWHLRPPPESPFPKEHPVYLSTSSARTASLCAFTVCVAANTLCYTEAKYV